jgi:hypothetical protein
MNTPKKKDVEAKDDLRQIGVSKSGQKVLDAMDAGGLVSEQMDAYRLAIATAIAFGRSPRGAEGTWKNKYSVGGVDPQQDLRVIVAQIYPEYASTPYRAIQDLADQGLDILADNLEGGMIFFGEMVEKIKKANAQGPADAGSVA